MNQRTGHSKLSEMDTELSILRWRDIVRPVSDVEKQIVRAAQLVLRTPQTGEMDPATVTRLRGVQALYRLPMTGILDKATWEKLNEMRWVDHSIQE